MQVSVGILGFFLREIDQKFKFGGTVGCDDSLLEFLFGLFKMFRLHAILHDAAGAVRAHSGEGHGYCYMIGRGRNSCLLSHVTLLHLRKTLFAFHFRLC